MAFKNNEGSDGLRAVGPLMLHWQFVYLLKLVFCSTFKKCFIKAVFIS